MKNQKRSTTQVKGLFLIAFICLLILSVFSYNRIKTLFASAEVVNNSNLAKLELERMSSLLKDAEGQQRGYLLTRQPVFLEEYRSAVNKIGNQLNKVQSTIDKNPTQQNNFRELAELTNQRTLYLQETVNASDSALSISQFLEGRKVMDDMRTVMSRMLREEDRLLHSRANIFSSETEFTPFLTITLILFSLLVLVLAYWRITHDLEKSYLLQDRVEEQSEIFRKRSLLYEHMLGANIDMVAVLDKELKVIAANPSAESFLSANDKDIFGKQILELQPTLKNEPAFENLQKALSGEKITITEYKSAFNNKYWELHFTPLILDGQIYAAMVTAHDITDLVNINRDLKVSEERYHRMIENVSDYAIIYINRDGIIENWNKGAESIKGYEAEEIIGKHFSLFYPQKDLAEGLPGKLLDEAINNGKAVHEGFRIRKDGTAFWGSVIINSIKDGKDNVIGFTKVTRDLTELKKRNEAIAKHSALLERKNKELESMNNELQSFAYVASHDLQEPLRKIQTFSDRILENDAQNLSEKGKEYFQRMKNAAERMQNLIEDLLNYARANGSDSQFEEVDLAALVSEAKYELKELIESKGARITESNLPHLRVIPFQFRQLIHNLISNSIKFAREGITPEISIICEKGTGEFFGDSDLVPEQEYNLLKFSDNGIGFEMQYNKRIFEIFQRLHGKQEYKGTGIGLAICKKIVEAHDGIIKAESVPGNGAKFLIYLPAS